MLPFSLWLCTSQEMLLATIIQIIQSVSSSFFFLHSKMSEGECLLGLVLHVIQGPMFLSFFQTQNNSSHSSQTLVCPRIAWRVYSPQAPWRRTGPQPGTCLLCSSGDSPLDQNLRTIAVVSATQSKKAQQCKSIFLCLATCSSQLTRQKLSESPQTNSS